MEYMPTGSTDRSIFFKLAENVTISQLELSYVRIDDEDATSTTETTATLTALASIITAHTDNYGVFLSSTASDAAYFWLRVDVPDAVWASGATRVLVGVYSDGDSVAADKEYILTPPGVNVKQISDGATAADNLESACNNYSVTRGLSGTALPAAAANAAGGLPISAAGGLNLDALGVKITSLPSGIKKNTALSNFTFTMVDSNNQPLPGLTVAGTARIDAGSFGALTNSASHVASGVYSINLAAADLNGTIVTLRFTATGAEDHIIHIKTDE